MIQHMRHRIRLPDVNFSSQPESDVYFLLDHEDGRSEHIRFHDYDSIYGIPGLYEPIFYERLKCDSPRFIAQLLNQVLAQSGDDLNRPPVPTFGARHALMGEELAPTGGPRLVGAHPP